MQQRVPPPRNPKAELTKCVALLLAAGLFWLAGNWGWPGAWVVAGLMGLAALGALRETLRAHRNWETRNEILEKAQTPGERFTTRWDAGRRHPDGWE